MRFLPPLERGDGERCPQGGGDTGSREPGDKLLARTPTPSHLASAAASAAAAAGQGDGLCERHVPLAPMAAA